MNTFFYGNVLPGSRLIQHRWALLLKVPLCQRLQTFMQCVCVCVSVGSIISHLRGNKHTWPAAYNIERYSYGIVAICRAIFTNRALARKLSFRAATMKLHEAPTNFLLYFWIVHIIAIMCRQTQTYPMQYIRYVRCALYIIAYNMYTNTGKEGVQ